jgi:hypothetical protein
MGQKTPCFGSQNAPIRWSEPPRQTDFALPAAALLQGGTIKPRFHPGAPITERQPRFYRTDLIPEAPERHGPREGLRRRNSVERAYLGEKHSLLLPRGLLLGPIIDTQAPEGLVGSPCAAFSARPRKGDWSAPLTVPAARAGRQVVETATYVIVRAAQEGP